MENVRAHVIISGLVQGVFFRAYTKDQAKSLGLSGWVRNLPDGNVEAIFEGPEDKVKEMINWCYKGSPSSKVETVRVNYEDYKGEFPDFFIRY